MRIANPEKAKKQAREWRLAHPEQANGHARKWQRDHLENGKIRQARRRARKFRAKGHGYATDQHVAWRFEMWGGRCYACGEKATDIDHVIPLAKGGAHFPANIRPICKRCNSRKGAMPLRAFMSKRQQK
jgi:5-methylcytosine-specific restriction endonuclease McrA